MSNPLEAAITDRLVKERMAGRQPVLTLDEVTMLGGEVEDGHIDRFGPIVSQLIDQFGADVVPDDGPQVVQQGIDPESGDLSDEESARIIAAHQQGIDERRIEKAWADFKDGASASAQQFAIRRGTTVEDELLSAARGRAYELRESGKKAEAEDMFAAVKYAESLQRGPVQTTGQKLEAAIAEAAD